MKLTEGAIKRYVEGGGVHCPYCLGTDIVGHQTEITESGCFQEIDCENCGKTWTDEYKLSGITEHAEEKQ